MRVRTLRIQAVLVVVVGTGLLLSSLIKTCSSNPLVSWRSCLLSQSSQPTHTLINLTLADMDTPDQGDTVVYYINLSHRPDRKKSIVKQLGFLGLPFNRMEAVDFRDSEAALTKCWDVNDLQRCAGKLGCKASHVKVLELHEQENIESMIIFEDDFVWLSHVDPIKFSQVLKDFEYLFPDWKVLGLSMNIIHKEATNITVQLGKDEFHASQVMEIREAQTTHGYAIRASYIPVLLAVWKGCDVTAGLHVAIDQCWKPLQAQGGWYAFSPQLGTQNPGYSDIESMEVKYDIS